MKFGVAKELITPDFATHMIGFAECYKKTFNSIHDDIFVRAIVMDDGKSRHLILSFDLLFHDLSLTLSVNEEASKYNIKPEQIMVSYTHTHYAPAVNGYFSELSHPEYEIFLRERMRSCIRKCFLNFFDGIMLYGRIRADENISRRNPVNGMIEMAPCLSAEKDDELNIFCINDLEGNTRSILFSYSCHPVTMKARMTISSEFPGRVCSLLESEYYGCTPLFVQALAGDVRPRLTAVMGKFVPGSFEDIDEMALALFQKIKTVVARPDRLTPVMLSLKGIRFVLPLKLKVFDRDYFEKELETNDYEALRYRASVILKNYDTMTDICPLAGGVWQLALGFYMVFLGGEVCSDTKRVIRKAFPNKNILVTAYNDSTAYIPSDKIIAEGGYEAEGSVTEYTLKGRFVPGIDEMMIKIISEAFNQFSKDE